MSKEWELSINAFVSLYVANATAEYGDYKTASEESHNLFTSENFSQLPELEELFDMFVDCFFELSESYASNDSNLSKGDIEQLLLNDKGKITVMKGGDWKQIHNHDVSQATGIFYLDTVDNDQHGGQLVLHDPSFNHLKQFCGNKTMSIDTVKHRMIVLPAHVWHEVTPYLQSALPRYSVIIDLHL